MFEDGLHNMVDIFRLNRNMSNRTVKDVLKISDLPDFRNVACRIVRDEKAIFAGSFPLNKGDTMKDLDSGIVYEVTAKKQVRGIGLVHHSSYEIRIKAESARHGN